VFIQCVGSRDVKYHTYCSKVCCIYMLKQARLIKERYPEVDVYIHLIDVRAPGKDIEEYYTYSRQLGINILRGKVGGIEVLPGDRLRILGFDSNIGMPIEVEADLVVLATAIELPKDAIKLARKLGISIDSSGFFKEMHPKLKSVETTVDGVFIAGCCQGPKDISETVTQAKAVAAAAAKLMSSDTIKIEPYIAEIVKEKCSGCGLCVSLCPYKALSIELNERTSIKLDAKACMGCGICVSICPSEVITINRYTNEQISSQITQYIHLYRFFPKTVISKYL